MSVKSKPSTARQAAGSKISETRSDIRHTLRIAGRIAGVQSLPKGANAPLPPGPVSVLLTASAPVDVSALLLTANRTVRGDTDFVFYNQPQAPGVRYRPDGVDVDPAAVDAEIECVTVTASLDGSGPATFGALGRLQLEVAVAGAPVASFEPDGLGAETALLCVEIYRRAGAWKVRAVGQGYADGLAGIAADFGITVEEPVAAPAPPPPPASTKITLDKGRVSLAKRQTVSLTKRGAPALRRVAMGLGWDPAASGRSIDLDASAIAIDRRGRKSDAVWFMSKSAYRGAIEHSGDNLTGARRRRRRDDHRRRCPRCPRTWRPSCSWSTPSRGRSSPRCAAPTAGCSTWTPAPSWSGSTSPTPSRAPAW